MKKVLGLLGLIATYTFVAAVNFIFIFLLNLIGAGILSFFNHEDNIFLNIVVGVFLFGLVYGGYLFLTVKRPQIIPMDKSKYYFLNFNLPITTFTALVLVPLYFEYHAINWNVVLFSFFYFAFTSLCISTGYHRYFAHHSYKASPLVEWYLLIFSPATFYGPVVEWAGEHQMHHKFEDTEQDPHAINKGFWNAHWGWLFYRKVYRYNKIESNARVMWQDKYHGYLALGTAFGIPTLIGYFLGSWEQGFLIGGIFRLVYFQHLGFLVNSLSHYSGERTSSSSATNNAFLKLIGGGEGLHSNHHKYPSSYTTRVKKGELDPSGWLVYWWDYMGIAKIHDHDKLKTPLN